MYKIYVSVITSKNTDSDKCLFIVIQVSPKISVCGSIKEFRIHC